MEAGWEQGIALYHSKSRNIGIFPITSSPSDKQANISNYSSGHTTHCPVPLYPPRNQPSCIRRCGHCPLHFAARQGDDLFQTSISRKYGIPRHGRVNPLVKLAWNRIARSVRERNLNRHEPGGVRQIGGDDQADERARRDEECRLESMGNHIYCPDPVSSWGVVQNVSGQ